MLWFFNELKLNFFTLFAHLHKKFMNYRVLRILLMEFYIQASIFNSETSTCFSLHTQTNSQQKNTFVQCVRFTMKLLFKSQVNTKNCYIVRSVLTACAISLKNFIQFQNTQLTKPLVFFYSIHGNSKTQTKLQPSAIYRLVSLSSNVTAQHARVILGVCPVTCVYEPLYRDLTCHMQQQQTNKSSLSDLELHFTNRRKPLLFQ